MKEYLNREEAMLDIVRGLSPDLIYWAVIRCWAHATVGEYGNDTPDSVSIGMMLDRWAKKYQVR